METGDKRQGPELVQDEELELRLLNKAVPCGRSSMRKEHARNFHLIAKGGEKDPCLSPTELEGNKRQKNPFILTEKARTT